MKNHRYENLKRIPQWKMSHINQEQRLHSKIRKTLNDVLRNTNELFSWMQFQTIENDEIQMMLRDANEYKGRNIII